MRNPPRRGSRLLPAFAAVGTVMWTVREGRENDFRGELLVSGYRSPHPVREPSLGEVLSLPDGSGPWRVVDWKVTSQSASPGNVLVVEPLGD
jgi:hypothetical protein